MRREYSVIFKKDTQHKPYGVWYDQYVHIAGPFPCIEGAAQARKLCGDLVVDSQTLEVVPDPSWLWDWELNDPQTYAHRHVAHAMGKL